MKHPKMEQTLVLIKPDGVQRTLIGEIMKRYERIGLKLVALKMCLPTGEQVQKHYTHDPEWIRLVGEKSIQGYAKKGRKHISDDPITVGEFVLEHLKKYMTSGPVIAMVWEGAHAVEIVRKITGATEPLASDVGTIRGDFVLDSFELSNDDGRAVRNLIHASSSLSDAGKEIALWFTDKEIVSYRLIQDEILYDVNLDGLRE